MREISSLAFTTLFYLWPSKEFKMDLPINAKVYCQDKLCGRAQAVLLDPASDIVTHIVVKESINSHAERLVPIDMIDASLAENIHLKLDTTMLQNLPLLYDMDYMQVSVPHLIDVSDIYYIDPVIVPEQKIIQEKSYHIPTNELSITRGTHVHSADRYTVGTVDEFLVDRNGGQVTQLILRKGHMFNQEDVFVPVAELEKITESEIRLKIDKKEIDQLPAIPARHLSH